MEWKISAKWNAQGVKRKNFNLIKIRYDLLENRTLYQEGTYILIAMYRENLVS